jgi:hypothetical protein
MVSEKSYAIEARLDTLIGGRVTVIKPGGTNRSSTTTLTDDPHLTVTLAASTSYWLELCAAITSPAAADFKWDFTFPAGLTFTGYSVVSVTGGASLAGGIWSPANNALSVPGICNTTGGGVDDFVSVHGMLTTAGTAGAFTWRWAQFVSDPGNTAVRAGSSMIVQRSG